MVVYRLAVVKRCEHFGDVRGAAREIVLGSGKKISGFFLLKILKYLYTVK